MFSKVITHSTHHLRPISFTVEKRNRSFSATIWHKESELGMGITILISKIVTVVVMLIVTTMIRMAEILMSCHSQHDRTDIR